jgi:hypothetical protein
MRQKSAASGMQTEVGAGPAVLLHAGLCTLGAAATAPSHSARRWRGATCAAGVSARTHDMPATSQACALPFSNQPHTTVSAAAPATHMYSVQRCNQPAMSSGRCMHSCCPSRSTGSCCTHAAASAGLPTLFSQASPASARAHTCKTTRGHQCVPCLL